MKTIVKGCVDGERWAQKVLFEKFYGLVYKICLVNSCCEYDAKELLQLSFIKIFKKIHKYSGRGSLKSWVNTVVRNLIYDEKRLGKIKFHFENIDEKIDLRCEDGFLFEKTVEEEKVEKLLESIQKLSPAYKTVFNLKVFEGKQHKEIAEMLKISESTSKTNYFKAKKNLIKNLKAKNEKQGN